MKACVEALVYRFVPSHDRREYRLEEHIRNCATQFPQASLSQLAFQVERSIRPPRIVTIPDVYQTWVAHWMGTLMELVEHNNVCVTLEYGDQDHCLLHPGSAKEGWLVGKPLRIGMYSNTTPAPIFLTAPNRAYQHPTMRDSVVKNMEKLVEAHLPNQVGDYDFAAMLSKAEAQNPGGMWKHICSSLRDVVMKWPGWNVNGHRAWLAWLCLVKGGPCLVDLLVQ